MTLQRLNAAIMYFEALGAWHTVKVLRQWAEELKALVVVALISVCTLSANAQEYTLEGNVLRDDQGHTWVKNGDVITNDQDQVYDINQDAALQNYQVNASTISDSNGVVCDFVGNKATCKNKSESSEESSNGSIVGK